MRKTTLCTITATLAAISLNAQSTTGTPGGSNLQPYSIKYCKPNVAYCIAGINAAIQAALAYMNGPNGGDYTIQIDPTVVDLSQELPGDPAHADSTPHFNLSPLSGAPYNLTFRGAGQAFTRIITHNGFPTIAGYGVSNVHFEDMTFNRDSMTTTQGTFTGQSTTGTGANAVTQVFITIQPGFPLPILSSQNTSPSTVADFGPVAPANPPALRVYDDSNPLDPRILTDPDSQQAFFNFSQTTCNQGATSTAGTPCVLTLLGNLGLPKVFTRLPIANNPNYLVGLKIETANNAVKLDGQRTIAGSAPGTTTTINGANVTFTNVDWTDEARMQLTHIANIQIIGNNILRRLLVPNSNLASGYQSPLMSTDAGGPQIGSPYESDFQTTGLLIKDFTAMATGDDSIAIFFQGGAPTSQVTNTNISSSFARTINVDHACSVHFNRNSANQCDQAPNLLIPAVYQGCISDTPQVCNVPIFPVTP